MAFADPSVVCEGWYPVARSRTLRRNDVKRAAIGNRRIVVFRDAEGKPHALDGECGHLGADLARGTVTTSGLRCAFHAWCWSTEGRCVAGGGAAEGRAIEAYEVRERWGLVWVWAGGSPRFELPTPEPAHRRHVLRLPEQRLACHPHVMLGNGLDVTHVGPVHRFRFLGAPKLELEPPHRASVDVAARFEPTALRRALGLAGATARWRFSAIGASLAWVRAEHPVRFELLWSGTPLPDGGCASRTIFFFSRWSTMIQAIPMMIATTWADRKVLHGIRFRPGFVPSDAVFASYARLVNAMPIWSPSTPGMRREEVRK